MSIKLIRCDSCLQIGPSWVWDAMAPILCLLLLVAGCATSNGVASVWQEIPVIPEGATECCEDVSTCHMVQLSYPNAHPMIPLCVMRRILVKVQEGGE